MNKAQKIAKPKVLYKECFIQSKGEETITIDDIIFASRVLRMNLDQAERVFAYVTTCGKEVDEIEIPQGDFPLLLPVENTAGSVGMRSRI